MGRHRTKNKQYPPRFHVKGRVCYHVALVDGKRIWTKLGKLDNLPAALAEWAKIENAQKPVTGDTFGALAAKYRALLEDPNNPLDLKPSTRKEYLRQIRSDPPATLIQAFGYMQLADIKPKHIGDYLDKHPSSVSANREIALTSKMLRYAIRKGIININPCEGIERNKERGRDRYVEDYEYVAVRNFAWNRASWKPLACAMDLSYLTSLRKEDILELQIGDFDNQLLRVREGKTGWKARIEMTPELANALHRCRSLRRRVSSFFLITSRIGMRYSKAGFDSAWQRMINSALNQEIIQERFTFHDIRAKSLSDRDEQDLNAQLAGGHPDPVATARYIRHRKGRKFRPIESKIVEDSGKL
jgi:integrase